MATLDRLVNDVGRAFRPRTRIWLDEYGRRAHPGACLWPLGIPASSNAPGRRRCNREHMALRCLIVDDNPSYLEAARSLLEREGLDVVGAASTSEQALRQAHEQQPDVVLVDVALGTENG